MLPNVRLLSVPIVAVTLAACLEAPDDPDLGEVEEEVLNRDHRNPSLGGSEHRIETSTIFEMGVSLTAGQTVTFQTRNRSAGSDPVLHLLAPVTVNGVVNQVASDDDSAGDYNARFTYTPTVTGTHLLIMRAAWKNKQGTAQILRNGSSLGLNLPFGGGFQRFENLRVNEELVTAPLPGAIESHTLYLLDDSGRILERHRSASNLRVLKTITAARPVAVAMVGPNWPNAAGPLRLVRNDRRLSGHDPDGDLLGTELETFIGTCSRTTDAVGSFACSSATDMRDTDGDGLRDDYELLGKLTSAPYQLLPRWGANPRHKDLFLEVDYLAADNADAAQRLSPDVARDIAKAYADTETLVLFRLANAQTLRNPDLQPGIALHFDTGMSPVDPADATLYGNWGGHNWVPPVCNGTACSRADTNAVWTTQMHANRRGVFHYIGGYPGGGGQAAPHLANNAMPMSSAVTAAHELGHSLGLGHNGPYDGEPVDANCKPNYASLMNYAYDGEDFQGQPFLGFSDGYVTSAAINNVAMREQNAASPGSSRGLRFLQQMDEIYGYTVDTALGHVDWNRDGMYSPGTVRAYANNNGSSCEFTKYNIVGLTSQPTRSPALVRSNRIIYTLSVDKDNTIAFEYTASLLDCPAPATTGCGSAPQRMYPGHAWNQNITAVDAVRVRDGTTTEKVLVVYRTASGELWETSFTSSPAQMTTPVNIPTIAPHMDEFSLATDGSTVFLAYKATSGVPLTKKRVAGVWQADRFAYERFGGQIGPLGAGVSPSLLYVGPEGAGTLYAIFPAAGQMRLFSYDDLFDAWAESPWGLTSPVIVGKPAMAWVPTDAQAPLRGRMHVLSLEPGGNPQETVVRERTLISGLDGGGNPQTYFGLEGYHQNSWLYGFGLDLMFEAGTDSNLRLLLARKNIKDNDNNDPSDDVISGYLELRPKADGINDYPQVTWNDWDVLRVDLCRTLVSAGGTGLSCPAWAW